MAPTPAFFGPHPLAGIHHVCYRVAAIEAARGEMQRRGYRPMSDGFKRMPDGWRMVFLRPPRLPGPLVKLQESRPDGR